MDRPRLRFGLGRARIIDVGERVSGILRGAKLTLAQSTESLSPHSSQAGLSLRALSPARVDDLALALLPSTAPTSTDDWLALVLAAATVSLTVQLHHSQSQGTGFLISRTRLQPRLASPIAMRFSSLLARFGTLAVLAQVATAHIEVQHPPGERLSDCVHHSSTVRAE